LVESKWDSEKKTSKQKVLEYLGSLENLTIDNIPKDYRTGSIRKFFVKNQTKLNEEVIEKQKNLEMILTRCLLTGDEDMSTQKSDELIKLIGLQRFYVESITNIMTETGKRWYDGEIGIAEEHMITNVIRKIVEINNHKIEVKGLIEGVAVICNPEGDDHTLSNLVLEGLLKIRKYKVVNIGGNWYMGEKTKATNKAIIDFAVESRPDIVFISVTIARYLFNAKLIAKELSKGLPDTKVFLGGLGTQGIIEGELQEGIHLANKDTLSTLNTL
jgi:methanogenic corrinoid protein MtbC1